MKKFMNMLAFVGLVLVAFALLLSVLLNAFKLSSDVVGIIERVGACMAYIVTMVYAFYFVKGKRNVWWWVAYWVSVVVVVLLVVLRFAA